MSLCVLMAALVSARPAAWMSQFPKRGSRTWRANRPDYSTSPHQPRLPVASHSHAHTDFNVLDFGAKGDNATDNTKAFTAALLAAHKAGGATVIVPTGIFKFKGSLTIPPGVALSGSYDVVPSHDLRGNHPEPLTDGTVLIPTAGRGVECDINCTDAFIYCTENALVRGLVILYDEQERVNTPVPYPWAIFLGDPHKTYADSADNAAVEDVEILGAWNGIAAVQAHRHYIARIQGHPLNIGVFVDATYDIGRIEDVHFNPWFSDGKPFIYYQTTHGRAFVMGRSDWEYVFNTFAFGYAIGYHFIERASGSMNGNFLGIGADLMVNASVQVDQSQPFGILITNGEFTAFCDAPSHAYCQGPGANTTPVHLKVGPKNNGAIKFSNSAFWGPAAQIAITEGTGTISFTQCHFDAWDRHVSADGKSYVTKGSPAVSQVGGTLILAENEFVNHDKGVKHLTVGDKASKTIVTNNIITGVLDIVRSKNPAPKAKFIVANNADDS